MPKYADLDQIGKQCPNTPGGGRTGDCPGVEGTTRKHLWRARGNAVSDFRSAGIGQQSDLGRLQIAIPSLRFVAFGSCVQSWVSRSNLTRKSHTRIADEIERSTRLAARRFGSFHRRKRSTHIFFAHKTTPFVQRTRHLCGYIKDKHGQT